MIGLRKYSAYLLLGIYSIVFAHSVIPHHHHGDFKGENFCVQEVQSTVSDHHHCHSHSGHTNNGWSDVIEHHHNDEPHQACHFEVQPVAGKNLQLAVHVSIDLLFDVDASEEGSQIVYQDIIPQKLPEGYNFAVPLRAPPHFFA